MAYNEVDHLDKTYKALQQQEEENLRKLMNLRYKKVFEIVDKSSKSELEKAKILAQVKENYEKTIRRNIERSNLDNLKKAHEIEKKYKQDLFNRSSRQERAELLKNQALARKAAHEKYLQEKKQLEALRAADPTVTDKNSTSPLAEEFRNLSNSIALFEATASRTSSGEISESGEAFKDLIESVNEVLNDPTATSEQIAAAKETLKSADALAATAEEHDQVVAKNFEAEAKDREKAIKDRNQQKKDEMKWLLKTEEGRTQLLKNATVKMVGALSKAFDALEQPINSFYEYQAKYEARMQGSENQYNKMMSNIGFSIGLSPFIKQQKMVENLQRLIDTGTNYNLELRAYIATVSENIASTFDAFDSNLMRLIRIQQNDSTAARMGMEAALTKILNSRFSDSSYLGTAGGSGLADTVAGKLLDASAQLSHQMATEFEFVTQKWLGALYSLGVGDETISNIAQGLGYLGSGNIDALAGNDQLMSLLAMSAARGGASISDFLTGNLTASNTEKLLKGMVELLGDIANNTDSNKVTRAAFANVFGITNTDLRSISNLTQSDIDYLSGTNLNYSQALVESSNQLREISSRMHISTMISNLIDNAQTSSALMIGGNVGTYTLYKALNVVSSLVGDRGMEIPGITALGTGTASGIDILSVAKAAIAGGGLLASLIGSLGNLGSGGLPALDRWAGYEKSLQRGEGLVLKDYGVQSGFSSSAQYNTSNQSSDDMTKAAMQSSKETATENMSEEDKAAQDSAKQYQDKMSQLADNIMKLIGENAENSLKVFISNKDSDKAIPVKLLDLGADAETKLQRAISLMITGNLADGFESTNDISLVDVIKSALNGANVHIDNDYFDDFYQKQFTNIGGM